MTGLGVDMSLHIPALMGVELNIGVCLYHVSLAGSPLVCLSNTCQQVECYGRTWSHAGCKLIDQTKVVAPRSEGLPPPAPVGASVTRASKQMSAYVFEGAV